MQSKKILLFGNSDTLSEKVTLKLLMNDFQVQAYSSCTHNVCEIVSSEKPAAVVLDLESPEIGGERAAILLKSNNTTKNIPLILFSEDPEATIIAKMVNAEGIVSKTDELNTLVESVARVIEKHRTNNETPIRNYRDWKSTKGGQISHKSQRDS